MSETKVVEKIKIQILCSINFFSKIGPLMKDVEKYCIAGQATDDNTIRRMSIACRVPLATKTHSEYVAVVRGPLGSAQGQFPRAQN